jgi:hypothetical protein
MNMTTHTHLNAGRNQRRETLVSDRQAANLKVKTRVRAGTESWSLHYAKVEMAYAQAR